MKPVRTAPQYLPQLDGVRALAVLLVLWAHFPYISGSPLSQRVWQFSQSLRTGYLGVDLFFVLSGFLITRILLAERAQSGAISFRAFFRRRFLRIFPIYYLCVTLYALVYARGDGDVLTLATYMFNYFKPFHPGPIALEHTWSLSVEEQFYIIWPFVISAMPLRWGRAATLVAIPLVSLSGAVAIAALFEPELAGSLIYMSGLTRMLSLSLGASLAFEEASGMHSGRRAISYGVLGASILVADNIGRAVHVVPAGGDYWCGALLGYGLLCRGAIDLLRGAGGLILGPIRRLLCVRPLRYVGQISYGLYLYHYLILFLLNIAPYQTGETGASSVRMLGALVLTFAVAAASYHFLERPFLRLKDPVVRERNSWLAHERK